MNLIEVVGISRHRKSPTHDTRVYDCCEQPFYICGGFFIKLKTEGGSTEIITICKDCLKTAK